MFNDMVFWRDTEKSHRYIHGILNDTLKVYDMVYQLSRVFQQEYEKILKIDWRYVKGMLNVY